MNAPKGDEFSVDDLGFIQIVPTKVLAAVARGEVDLNALARRELANRGLDMHGRWVGFEKAARLATYFVHRMGGRLTYVSVPEKSESVPARTRYVIRDNDGLYVVAFDIERRAISLCDNVEQAKRFGSHLAANRFRRKHAGGGYGLSDAAAIVPSRSSDETSLGRDEIVSSDLAAGNEIQRETGVVSPKAASGSRDRIRNE